MPRPNKPTRRPPSRAGALPGPRPPGPPAPNPTDTPGLRKSLTNIGGPTRFSGDPAFKRLLESAFTTPEAPDDRTSTHGFHAWPARLHPHTARVLIAAAPPGAIADPFMGGGTVPLEARLAGRLAVGNDLNPIGLEVAWVRTRRLDAAALRELNDATRLVIKLANALRDDARPHPTFRERVGYAFDPQSLHEVWSLATIINDTLTTDPNRSSHRILRAALSSIIVKVSKLVSDSVAKVDRTKTNFTPKGRVDHWLKKRIFELSEQLQATARLLPAASPDPLLFLGDARVAPPKLPPLAAIISSPPYPGIYDYVDHHKLRLMVLGLPVAPMVDQEIGSRRESERLGLDVGTSRYVTDLEGVLTTWSKTLVPNGFVAFVIGDGQVEGRITPVLPLLERAATSARLWVRAFVSQPRPVFGTKGHAPKMKDEHLVLLTR
jgi:hypothetical protein